MVNARTGEPPDDKAPDPGNIDRDLPDIASKGNNRSMLHKGAVVALVAAALGGFFLLSGGEEPVEDSAANDRQSTLGVTRPYEPAPLPVEPAVVELEPEPEQVPVWEEDEPKQDINELLEASRRAPVIAFSGGSGSRTPAAESGQPGMEPVLAQGGDGSLFGEGGKNLAAHLQATRLDGVSATRIHNMHMTVPKGTHIPCTLETAVSSDVPGFVTCIVSRDVMSASGQVVLAEKGSRVLGEYLGNLQNGQRRIFVLWNELRTPTGVVVGLDSPASDALGRAGFSGRIDRKWRERFGNALLFSVLTDASKYAFGRISDGEVETEETENTAQDATATILEQSLAIPPTLYMNQGALVNVLVARDLDFSSVYKLTRAHSRKQIRQHSLYGNGIPMPKRQSW